MPLLMCSIDSVRADVLVNMAFNMGVNGLLKFKKMIAAIDDRNYDEAAIEMLNSRWAVQVGKRANELSKQMRTGEYS
jgi:lysozyme